MNATAKRVVRFYNQRGMAEQWIKEGKNAVNWTRLKEETQKSHENNDKRGRGVFAFGRKWALGAKNGIETSLRQRITRTDWYKVLANRWDRKRITKKAQAGRGLETIWEIPNENKNYREVSLLENLSADVWRPFSV